MELDFYEILKYSLFGKFHQKPISHLELLAYRIEVIE